MKHAILVAITFFLCATGYSEGTAAVSEVKKEETLNSKTEEADVALKEAQEWIQKDASLKEAVEEKKKVESMAESDIPVLKANPSQKEKVLQAPSFLKIAASLIIVLTTIFCISFFFKKYATKSPKNKYSQIKIITQHYMGPKKSLAIIHVAGESLLIGVTDNSINLIKPLALLDEELPEEISSSFTKSLKNALDEKTTKNKDDSDDLSDEFSFSKVKDFVSGKLKNMKEL